MLVRVVLPHLGANLPRGHLAEWIVLPGSRAEFGDALCRVRVSDRVLLRGTRWASSLLAHSRRTGPRIVAYEEERGQFETSYEIVASEQATVVRHLKEEGQPIEVGDVLGLAETGSTFARSDRPEDFASAPLMRVIARLVMAEGL